MQEAQIAPPPPPTPPAPPQIVIDGAGPGVIQTPVVVGSEASPSEILQAFQAQRDELRGQLNSLTSERYSIARRLREGEVSGVDKAGLESRMQVLDARIIEQSKAVAAADLRVATQKGVPGAYIPPFRERGGPPEKVISMAFVLALVILVPTSLAIARRIWRRGSRNSAPVGISPEIDERLTRLELAMDAVAVEVERVGEGQRYVTRILGAGAAQPVAQRVPERIEVPR
jgi:hypothetical protein